MQKSERSCLKDEKYRYLLTIRWLPCPLGKRLVAIMCNPSKADEKRDDTTTHILRKWASERGYGEVRIINLFSYKTTLRDRLFALTDEERIGEKSNRIILDSLLEADTVIAAWGDAPHGLEEKFIERAQKISDLIAGSPIYVVGRLTAGGSPRHPRRWYLEGGDLELHPFNIPEIF